MPTIDIFRLERDFQTYSAGQTIFKAGDHGDTMLAMIEGEVNILIGGTLLETVVPGGIFGEMGVLDHAHVRSGSAVAKSDCKIVVINRKRFMFLVQQTPFFAIEVMQIMADRIRRNDKYIPKATD